ncbi:MAG: hypothetical protein JW770_03515 [Actinobacteria bacterium]|nr:hypothetical protein [Actinomycetota bacterium]
MTTGKILTTIIEIGPVVIIPSMLFVICLFTIRNVLKNFLNCLFIFLGFLSLSILLTIFVNFLGPLINTIIINSARQYDIIDTGWLVTEIVSFDSPILLHIFLTVIGINIAMLFMRFTRTINIDLWNYWNFFMVGSLIFAVTGIRWIGVLVAAIVAAITFVLSDIYAHYIGSYYGLKGISNPQAQVICWAPISHLVNTVFNKIPLLKRAHLFYEEVQYRLGVISEPMIGGFLIGFIIGLLTRYRTLLLDPWPNILYSILNGGKLSIIMVLLPRSVNILMKGLVPAIESIRTFIRKKITGRTIYIGLDSLVLVGHPSVISLSVIIIPLTVYLSTLLPGNRVLPGPDLIIIPFILVWAVIPSRGDLLRSFIAAVVIIPFVLWITTDMGQLFTNFFLKNEIALPEGYSQVSTIGGSSNIFFWALLQIVKPILNLFLQ